MTLLTAYVKLPLTPNSTLYSKREKNSSIKRERIPKRCIIRELGIVLEKLDENRTNY